MYVSVNVKKDDGYGRGDRSGISGGKRTGEGEENVTTAGQTNKQGKKGLLKPMESGRLR